MGISIEKSLFQQENEAIFQWSRVSELILRKCIRGHHCDTEMMAILASVL
ncbi:hypothetical protein GGQ79_004594 [Ochrobactrum pecoris]|uniref:Uncharacterized protein n=1 Tax=Brucella pecoris TaxID=867683 RepID=A0AB34Z0M5_9HYPH|nr:hypothetical protein [Brucella pecoris]